VKPGIRIGLAMFLVAVAGPAGFFAYRLLRAEHMIAAPGERRLTAELAASSRPSGTSAQDESEAPEAHGPVPEQLPNIQFPDRQGTQRKLSDWRGRPLLINFWATWCEPCRREIPLLKTLLRSSPADHLQVVGIAVDDRDAVLKYAQSMGIDYPILIGGEDGGVKAIDAFGMTAVLPFTVFADSRGRILTLKIGELHPDEAHLILERLQDVDAGSLTLASARQQVAEGLKTLAVERAKRSAT
jgi:thiol-disulfide isomerase/thioredoxin